MVDSSDARDEFVGFAPRGNRVPDAGSPRENAPARGAGKEIASSFRQETSSRCTVPNELANEDLAIASSGLPDRSSAARILARSFYKELRSSGYTPRQLVALSTELIALITLDLRKDREEVKRAA
jgi:hypothetical protein